MYDMEQSARTGRNSSNNRPVLGTSVYGTSTSLGEVEYSSQVGNSSEGRHHVGYSSSAKTWWSALAIRTKLRATHRRIRWSQVAGQKKTRKAQLKLSGVSKCQKARGGGILRCDWPWDNYDRKWASLLYLSIGTEGRQVFNRKEPHAVINDLKTIKFWENILTILYKTTPHNFQQMLF